MKDNYPDKTYLVELNPKDEDEPRVVYKTRWQKNGKKYPLWVDDPKECWKWGFIPVGLLDPDDESGYQKWADEASNGDPQIAREIERKISKLREKVANYNLPYLYLPVETPPHVAIDVFIKLNTNVAPLKPFDIIVAQMEEAVGESLHDMIESLKRVVPRIEEYTEITTYVLSVAALLQDNPPNQRGFFSLEFERLIEDWEKIERGTKELIKFLVEETIFDRERLPTESILPPLATLWSELPNDPDEIGNARILLRKYLWRSFFTERYDRAVPTAVLQDYRALKGVLKDEKSEDEIPCFNEKDYPLPNEEMLIQARWPKYRDRLGRAILLLSLKGDALDIADDSQVSPENIKKREYHHLYPRAWVKDRYGNEQMADKALNCILITWKTNRKISAKDPVQYLKERCEASALGEEGIRKRLKTHFVDFDMLASGDFENFLKYRAKMIMTGIEKLCRGEKWP
jgi:hypothetical protein